MTPKTRILNMLRRAFVNRPGEWLLRNLLHVPAFGAMTFRAVPPNYLYRPGSFRTFSSNGIQLRLDISDYVGHFLYFGFRDESHEKLFSLVKPGSHLVDVGANVGFTALVMSRLAGKTGVVHAFEPDPHNYSILQEHISANSSCTVTPWPLAAGNTTSTLRLEVRESGNRGMNRISESAVANYSEVSAVPIDDWVATNLITRIDLIKIDVEGYELRVLEGAARSVSKFRPVLFIELDNEHLQLSGTSAAELVTWLQARGYDCFRAVGMQQVFATDDLTREHCDIVCLPVK